MILCENSYKGISRACRNLKEGHIPDLECIHEEVMKKLRCDGEQDPAYGKR